LTRYLCRSRRAIFPAQVFLKLKTLLEAFGIMRYDADYWSAYTRHLGADAYQPGKRNTRQIERKRDSAT